MLAFLAGSDLAATAPFLGAAAESVVTPYGSVALYRGPGWALVLRHGRDGRVPPHRINHRAHIDALRQIGASGAIAFCSVGGLRPDLVPGSRLIPDDYSSLAPPITFHDHDACHVTPVLSDDLRGAIARSLEAIGATYFPSGVYCQTAGPRLETRAEIRMLARFADVVGMTFADEATLCAEAGIPVAALCSVVNLAHGVAGGGVLRAEDIDRRKAADISWLGTVARALLDECDGPMTPLGTAAQGA